MLNFINYLIYIFFECEKIENKRYLEKWED
jgi:hypothetical protein